LTGQTAAGWISLQTADDQFRTGRGGLFEANPRVLRCPIDVVLAKRRIMRRVVQQLPSASATEPIVEP